MALPVGVRLPGACVEPVGACVLRGSVGVSVAPCVVVCAVVGVVRVGWASWAPSVSALPVCRVPSPVGSVGCRVRGAVVGGAGRPVLLTRHVRAAYPHQSKVSLPQVRLA